MYMVTVVENKSTDANYPAIPMSMVYREQVGLRATARDLARREAMLLLERLSDRADGQYLVSMVEARTYHGYNFHAVGLVDGHEVPEHLADLGSIRIDDI